MRAVATAFPDTTVDHRAACRALEALFPDEDPSKIRSLVRCSGVETRRIVPSLEEALDPGDFTDRNRRYHREAVTLAASAAREALRRAQTTPEEVDVVIDVSCTGIAIPALDVDLVPLIGLRRNTRRVPIAEAGCAGGALALNLAASLAASGSRVLVIAVELCSLSLVGEDRSRTNLVASLLFGDGAAAAVVTPEGPGPRIRSMRSHLIPDTAQILGFDVGSHGLRIVLDRALPALMARHLPTAVGSFLDSNGLESSDLSVHLIHPGGRSILDAYEERFALKREDLRHSRKVLAEYGNLSSAAILAVLENALGDAHHPPSGHGILLAIGPGLSLEMALLDFDPA